MSKSKNSRNSQQISLLVPERSANPTRIALARKRRGLTQSELAVKLGLHRRSVCGFESGEYPPAEGTVQSLSSLLSFPEEFFYGDDIDEPTLETGSFRSMSRMSAAQRDMALSQAAFGLHLNKWLETKFDMPRSALPNLRYEQNPEIAAETLRTEWGLGQLKIRNTIHLLESKGVRVFSLAVDAREVDAFSMWKGSTPFVFLNTNKSAEHSRYDAAHELGHLVMHRDSPQGLGAEREADAFAAAFLMPRSSILAKVPKFSPVSAFVKLKKLWGVSVTALIHRSHSVGLLSDWQYRELCIELTKLGYRESEPDEIAREKSLVLPGVFESLREDGLTRPRIAQLLTLPMKELEALLFDLVLTSIDGGRKLVDFMSKPAELKRVK